MVDAQSFLDSQRGLMFGQAGEWFQLAIVDREDGALSGDCAVRVMADQPATAEMGITLARTSRGRGLVGRLFERLGFRCEARLVEADWFKREWSTLRIYAMLNREWRDRRRG